MPKKMTWEEMKNKFPDEWLLITDFDIDESGHVTAGIVKRHSKEKDDVYRLPALDESTAFRYTGKSSFRGLKSHVTKHNII